MYPASLPLLGYVQYLTAIMLLQISPQSLKRKYLPSYYQHKKFMLCLISCKNNCPSIAVFNNMDRPVQHNS